MVSQNWPVLMQSEWDEIFDVFGDGHKYDWALAGDEEMEYDEDHHKPEMKYQDVRSFGIFQCLFCTLNPPGF